MRWILVPNFTLGVVILWTNFSYDSSSLRRRRLRRSFHELLFLRFDFDADDFDGD